MNWPIVTKFRLLIPFQISPPSSVLISYYQQYQHFVHRNRRFNTIVRHWTRSWATFISLPSSQLFDWSTCYFQYLLCPKLALSKNFPRTIYIFDRFSSNKSCFRCLVLEYLTLLRTEFWYPSFRLQRNSEFAWKLSSSKWIIQFQT